MCQCFAYVRCNAICSNYCHELYALYLLQCTNLGQFATAFTRLPAIYESTLTQHQTRMHTSSQADINNLCIMLRAYAAATHGNSAQLGHTCRIEHQRRLACQHQATTCSPLASQHLGVCLTHRSMGLDRSHIRCCIRNSISGSRFASL